MPRITFRSIEDENTKLFREAIDALGYIWRCSRTEVFRKISAKQGVSFHWVRERYYGGQIPNKKELGWVRIMAGAPTAGVQELRQSKALIDVIQKHQGAISKFCHSCAGEPVGSPEALCWDGRCPLRPVSPLPVGSKPRP
jgi:hypothetical protein